MAKSVMKEIIIALLLCLAIILVLGILLYEYVPVSKTIPNQISYTTPEEARQELVSSEQVDESQIIMTYEVNSDDLNNYKRIKDYKPGKANPFSSYETQIQEQNKTNGTSTNQNGSTTNTNQSGTSTNTTTSGGQYFNDKGTK